MRNLRLSSLILLAVIFVLPSCVSNKKFNDAQGTISSLQDKNRDLREDLKDAQDRLQLMEAANADAADQLKFQDSALTQRQSELDLQQQKLFEQQKLLTKLQNIIKQQNQRTEQLKQKMEKALGNFNSEDLSVYKKDGKVYVRMSENLLFPSGSAVVNQKGTEALGELAKALNENPDINIDVEGHTDTVPIRVKFQDNWALSSARANAIVRILIDNYKVDPRRLVSSGRSQYDPVADNQTEEGRAKNRRTEIILAPNLDKLMELIDPETAQ